MGPSKTVLTVVGTMEAFCTQDRCGECPGRLICHCLQVTEDALQAAVATFALRTVSEIRQVTGAGTGCTACHRRLHNYLDQAGYSSASPICSAK
jgi:bacterioferritin-associated ferredoxin